MHNQQTVQRDNQWDVTSAQRHSVANYPPQQPTSIGGYGIDRPVNSFDTSPSFGGQFQRLMPFSAAPFDQSLDWPSAALNSDSAMQQPEGEGVIQSFFRSNNLGRMINDFMLGGDVAGMMSMSGDDGKDSAYMHSTTQMMSYSNINGKKNVVKSHDEVERGPGGVMRRRQMHDNRARRIKKAQEGQYIYDRGEVREQFVDPHTGQVRQQVHLKNIPQGGEETFREHWRQGVENIRSYFGGRPHYQQSSGNDRRYLTQMPAQQQQQPADGQQVPYPHYGQY